MGNQVDLNTLAGGALLERIGMELQKMADNIADPNTKAEAVRSVTVEIKVKPDETRTVALSEINVKSKLAASRGIPTKFIVDQDKDGRAVIAELVSGVKDQMMLGNNGEVLDDRGRQVKDQPPSDGKVVNFR